MKTELTKDKCKNCTVENMCTTGTLPNSDECLIKGKDDGMLTKEECLKAFVSLCEVVMDCDADGYMQPKYLKDYHGYDCDVIGQLIKEHFDNPPLSWKQVREMVGKPIYHLHLKRYFIICNIEIGKYREKIIKTSDNVVDCLMYIENVFFTREVKE